MKHCTWKKALGTLDARGCRDVPEEQTMCNGSVKVWYQDVAKYEHADAESLLSGVGSGKLLVIGIGFHEMYEDDETETDWGAPIQRLLDNPGKATDFYDRVRRPSI